MRAATPRLPDRLRAVASERRYGRHGHYPCVVALGAALLLPGCSSAGRDGAAAGAGDRAAPGSTAAASVEETHPMPEKKPGAPLERAPVTATPVPANASEVPARAGAPTGDADTSAVPAELLAAARADLAQRLAADGIAGTVRVIVAEAVTWSDGALGCPRPGMNYTMALVSGYRVVFGVRVGAEERRYAYHSGQRGPLAYCANPGSPVSGSGAI